MSEEKEYFGKIPNLTVLPWVIWAVILVSVIGALYAGRVYAEGAPFQAIAGKVTITVYDQPCTHVDQITNLPNRATWQEDGKVFDGCVGVISELGVAMFWFNDRTIAVVPLQMFHKVTAI